MKGHILLSFIAGLFFTQLPAQSNRPNIIVIVADDMGYGQPGSYGQKLVPTPCLDSLAAHGIRFTNYYAGSTVCAPSRETLLTGMHTGHTAIRGNFRLAIDDGNLPMAKDHPTISEYLHSRGYQTALFGKWGVGDSSTGPNSRGFDYSLCYMDQIKAHDYYPPYIWENDKRLELKENENGRKGLYSHHLYAEKTLDYIGKVRSDKPFFLYLPYTIPHGDYSLSPDKDYIDKPWPAQLKTYATMISLLDRDIGRIIRSLKERGLYDNTVIFFTSDNGANEEPAKLFKANGDFRGAKFGLYEGGIRVPLIASWPGKIKPSQVSDHIVASWDLLATICEITETPQRTTTDGMSFLPTLIGKQQPQHAFLYWEYYDYNYNWGKPGNKLPRNWLDGKAVRIGKWKGIQSKINATKESSIELYDLEKDAGEQKNIASENPGVVASIKKIMDTASMPAKPNFPYAE